MKSYDQVHAGLFYVRGKASSFLCACGKPAQDWAYQHNAGREELRSPSGAPYSEDLWLHYEAMCHPCHMRLDFTVGASERLQEARRRNGSKVGSDPGHFEGRQTNGKLVAAHVEERMKTDAEFNARCSTARRANGLKGMQAANDKSFRCECGRQMSRSNMGRHTESTRHRALEGEVVHGKV